VLLIENVTAVTVDSERRIVTDAAIAVDGERIAAIGKVAAMRARFPAAEALDGRGMAAIPGLIDTHGHADQSLLRGLGDEHHWIPLLDNIVEPYLRERSPADAVIAYQLSGIEMLRAGTTCFVSPNVDPRDDFPALTAALEALGIRAVLARWTAPDDGPDTPATARASVAAALADIEAWNGSAGDRVRMWFGLMIPRRPGDGVFPHFYRRVAAAARDLGTGITYHFCSEIEDSYYMDNAFGMRPAAWSHANDVLGPNVLAIGASSVTADELRILAETGTHVAHSPVANMKRAAGIFPLPDALAAGVPVALGTDGGLNNNSHDMFAEMKSALLLHNAVRRRASTIAAETMLELATIAGARAIGRERDLGSLEAGKLADIVLVDLDRPHTTPVHDIVSNLVLAANGANVDTVIVGGRIVVRGGQIAGVDERAVLADARAAGERVRAQLGLRPVARWPVS
jgi:cytosine/adenosine deaminase-related metal-dependent hydrolase